MITTGCEGCCFLKKSDQGYGCVLNQLCLSKDGQVFAPGYCRLCRSHSWANKQKDSSINTLYDQVIKERALKMDLLVFFDEARDTLADLERTLNSDWYKEYAQKIIILDVTGFGDRQNLALQYLKRKKHTIPTKVDSSVKHESVDQRGDSIRRISKQVTAPFFFVISAGTVMNNFDMFARTIQHVSSRVIHWSFPFKIGSTTVVPSDFNYGLFITVPYRALMKSPEGESFTKQLKKEELETEMGLSWFSADVWLS